MTNPSTAARQAANEASPWIERGARIGFIARGAVYIIIGGLAVQAAIGAGGETLNSKGALRVIAEQPLGTVMLWIVALGLACYGIWKLIEAASDPAGRGAGLRTLAAIKGIAHLVLAWSAGSLAMGAGAGSGGSGTVTRLIDSPPGRWIAILGGLGFAAYGISQIANAARAELSRDFRLSQLPEGTQNAVIQTSRFGIAARGVVFTVLGVLFALAAWRRGAAGEQDTGDALRVLGGLPGGHIILALIGIGLVAYGIYSILSAKYRRIDV